MSVPLFKQFSTEWFYVSQLSWLIHKFAWVLSLIITKPKVGDRKNDNDFPQTCCRPHNSFISIFYESFTSIWKRCIRIVFFCLKQNIRIIEKLSYQNENKNNDIQLVTGSYRYYLLFFSLWIALFCMIKNY